MAILHGRSVFLSRVILRPQVSFKRLIPTRSVLREEFSNIEGGTDRLPCLIPITELSGCNGLGANLDPSHMWWQGIDPAQAARYLAEEGCLFYFHAKDSAIDPHFVSYYGVTDMQSFSTAFGRAWQFRTVGFGHDLKVWADLFSVMRSIGYDGIVSIEHEDSYMSVDEGLDKAVANLRQVLMFQPPSKPKAFDLDERFKQTYPLSSSKRA